jgi:colanic acid/amylovoran biosynthesis glycosyltransferase
VPFGGSEHEAAALFESLRALRPRAGDELIVVDNAADLAAPDASIRVVRAPRQRSSYYARNVGAQAAANEWVLFMDADCRPVPELLDAYFAEPVGERVGALAGDVLDDPAQTALIARYTRSRQLLDADRGMEFAYKPQAVTANLMVRRAAWAALGGFAEGIRSGGDTDFSWRIQDAGWELRRARGAAVEHHHRETLRGYLRQKVRYGSSRAWLSRRYPGSYPPIRAWLDVPRAALAAIRWIVLGQFERGAFRALDAIGGLAEAYGFTQTNGVTPLHPGDADGGGRVIAVFADAFPAISETFIAQEALALERLGWQVRIEATVRAPRPDRAMARALPVALVEDDAPAGRLRDAAWLVALHPVAVAHDAVGRLRWRREEGAPPLRVIAPVARRVHRARAVHLHAHFAAGAALTALRVHRLLGLPYSVTAHAYDIYSEPRNLLEKLREADFATSGCDYTVNDLKQMAGPEIAPRIHKVIMGVDTDRMRRTRPHSGGRRVVSVGRLVEKKGFGDLIDAAALLGHAVKEVLIVGAGPLREELEQRIERHGIGERVQLAGARQPGEVLDLIQDADVLCLPCVVAANGDRDSMPVVVKEALAFEVPVVVTDEVGLPELVRPEFGALVPPHDPPALAAALRDLLDRSPEERAAMGRAGREFVKQHCNVDRETAKLARLIDAAG